MTQIIAFVGYKQVGKSTAAAYLESKYGFVRHNFKDALIAEITEKFPDLLREMLRVEMSYSALRNRQTYIDCIDDLFIQKPPLMRALMQNYGTEVRRGDSDTYWTDRWINKAEHLCMQNKDIVTDDVRFLNEAAAIKLGHGTIIRLTRPDITSGGDHSSETEQLQIEADYTIELEVGNEEKLHRELDRILSEYEHSL